MIIDWINRLVGADPVLDELFLKTEHTKVTMLTGFLKSTSGTVFISLGMGVIATQLFQTLIQYYPQYFYFTAIFFVAIGLIIYFVGDAYEIDKDKEAKRTQDAYYQDMIDDIAHTVISEADKKRDAEIMKRIGELRELIKQ